MNKAFDTRALVEYTFTMDSADREPGAVRKSRKAAAAWILGLLSSGCSDSPSTIAQPTFTPEACNFVGGNVEVDANGNEVTVRDFTYCTAQALSDMTWTLQVTEASPAALGSACAVSLAAGRLSVATGTVSYSATLDRDFSDRIALRDDHISSVFAYGAADAKVGSGSWICGISLTFAGDGSLSSAAADGYTGEEMPADNARLLLCRR